jgi:hypothetical protein
MYKQQVRDVEANINLLKGDYNKVSAEVDDMLAIVASKIDGITHVVAEFIPYGYIVETDGEDADYHYAEMTGFTATFNGLEVAHIFNAPVTIGCLIKHKSDAAQWDIHGECTRNATVYGSTEYEAYADEFKKAVTEASPILAKHMFGETIN